MIWRQSFWNIARVGLFGVQYKIGLQNEAEPCLEKGNGFGVPAAYPPPPPPPPGHDNTPKIEYFAHFALWRDPPKRTVILQIMLWESYYACYYVAFFFHFLQKENKGKAWRNKG